jgi:hypothetical protein
MEGTHAVGRRPFKPQTVLLRWRPSVGVGRFIRRSRTLERVVLDEPGFCLGE